MHFSVVQISFISLFYPFSIINLEKKKKEEEAEEEEEEEVEEEEEEDKICSLQVLSLHVVQQHKPLSCSLSLLKTFS